MGAEDSSSGANRTVGKVVAKKFNETSRIPSPLTLPKHIPLRLKSSTPGKREYSIHFILSNKHLDEFSLWFPDDM